MSLIPPPRATVAATPEFPFIAGRYSDSAVPVSYFVTVMRYRDAANSLRLVSELPGNTSMDWNIEELYQREIDWTRVKRGIVPYLRQSDSPHFFNAVTVALLPHCDGRLVSMSSGEWHAPLLSEPTRFGQGCIKKFGPITCGYWGPWTNPDDDGARLGCITWNIDEVAAVAIDGQHRLAAIKKLQGATSSKSSIPVILVVSHRDLGAADAHAASNGLGLTRRLFIDLNKHSVKVSRARQILLDDRDPVSLCTRTLVGEQLLRGDNELSHATLPLTLVDWHSEQAKFDKGPYVSTILGLDWIVERCTGLPATLDPMAYEPIEQFLARSSDTLGVELEEAQVRLSGAREGEAPFEFTSDDPSSDLERIKHAFKESWAPAVIHILTGLAPYKRLIRSRLEHGSLRPEFSGWWAAKSRRDSDRPGPAGDALQAVVSELQHLKERGCTPADFEGFVEAYEEAKRDHELAFAVAFQRALFSAFFTLLRAKLVFSDSESDEMFGPGETHTEGVHDRAKSLGHVRREAAEFFVDVLNKIENAFPNIYSRDASVGTQPSRYLWGGSLFSEENRAIDFTSAASERASDLIVSAVLMAYIIKEDPPRGRDAFDSLRRTLEGSDQLEGAVKKLAQAVGRMTKTGLGMRNAKLRAATDASDEQLSEYASEEVYRRLEAIWKHLRSNR
jgi:DGQHR domain-containing protein